RGLARAVGAKYRQPAAALDIQAEALESVDTAWICVRELTRLQQLHAVCSPKAMTSSSTTMIVITPAVEMPRSGLSTRSSPRQPRAASPTSRARARDSARGIRLAISRPRELK